jgi:hypothetical protein
MTTIAFPAERERLITLGTMAGAPGIIHEAMASGDIMNPAHLERAKQLGAQWEVATSLLAPYFARQKRIDEERERLRELGARMVGETPKKMSYAAIRAQLGVQPPLPEPTGWFLRIVRPDTASDFVDLVLTQHADIIEDCILDATRVVPRFSAWLYTCAEAVPVLVYEHA